MFSLLGLNRWPSVLQSCHVHVVSYRPWHFRKMPQPSRRKVQAILAIGQHPYDGRFPAPRSQETLHRNKLPLRRNPSNETLFSTLDRVRMALVILHANNKYHPRSQICWRTSTEFFKTFLRRGLALCNPASAAPSIATTCALRGKPNSARQLQSG